uniref:Acetylcholinesterase n=1 Tax=Parastrongyloides trichosuri TaxID=131310 RepID=A0A0N4Z9T1_PARTI
MLILYTLLFIQFFGILSYPGKIIHTSYGPVQGEVHKIYGRIMTKYSGIPFAEPMSKRNRFEPPKPLRKNIWKDVFNASKPGNACYQGTFRNGDEEHDNRIPRISISEDCLQLTMYVPKSKTGDVLIFFHGDFLLYGDSFLDIYDGSYLAVLKNVIVVNINYRLGIFGFGYLGEGKLIPGNLGLLDQQLGLKWVYENIASFGGNPNKITLWGQGMGSVFATAHLYSEESSKYFSKIIANSGTISNIWAAQSNEFVEEMTRSLAEYLNCIGEDKQILNCLKKSSPNSLASATEIVSRKVNFPYFYGFNIIERDDVFFKGNVSKKIEKNIIKDKFDILLGYSSNEGAFFIGNFLDNYKFGCVPKNGVTFNRNDCNINRKQYKVFLDLIQKQLKLSDKDISIIRKTYSRLNLNYRDKASKIISDIAFRCDIAHYAKNISSYPKRRVYLYIFDFYSSSSELPLWMEPKHGHELQYAFGVPYRYPENYNDHYLKKERKFSQNFMYMIKNFVATGEPGSRWKRKHVETNRAGILDFTLATQGPIKFRVNPYSKICKRIYGLLPKRLTLFEKNF